MKMTRTLFQFFAIYFAVFLCSGCATLEETELKQDRIRSENTMDLLSHADSAYTARDWIAAEIAYREIIVFMDKDEFSHFRLGNALLRQGRLREAMTHLETAIVLNSKFFEARHNLATCYLLLADAQMAALTQNPTKQQGAAQRKRALLQKAAAEPFL